jgi:hypothetical protein
MANIAAAQYGPTATTNQQNVQANTALVGQQTQGAQIANAQAAMRFQLFQQGMAHVMDFSGQNNGQSRGSDASGTTGTGADTTGSDETAQPTAQAGGAPSAQPSSAAPTAGPSVSPASVQPEDDIGASESVQPALESALTARYNVNPAGTAQEQAAIHQAYAYAAQIKMYGDPGLSAQADEQVEAAKNNRDMGVKSRLNAAQLNSTQHYNTLAAVEAIANDQKHQPGAVISALDAVAPSAADRIKKANPDATPAELDEIAADTTAHVAGFMHQFTGRETVTGTDGIPRDKISGLPVSGIPPAGMSQADVVKMRAEGLALVDSKTADGTPIRVPQFQVNGFQNIDQYMQQGEREVQSNQQAAAATTKLRGALTLQRPPSQGAVPPNGGPPQAAPPGGAAPQGGAPAQPGAQDNGMLPGVNVGALPKPTPAKTVPGQAGLSPQDQITASGIATKATEQFADANTQYTEAQKSGGLIRAAQRETNALANNPRLVGPGSGLAQGIAQLQTAVTGKPPDALVDFGSLNKILLTMGAQNIRQALSGQKITNQEFMTMLSKGNPNTEQPLATIQNLLQYLGTQNDYDTRFAKTKLNGLRAGADPRTIDADIAGQSNRGDYVESRVGVRPPLAQGSQQAPTSGGQMPAGAKLQTYAVTYFDGDLNKAQAYLSSQGYK